MGSTGPAMTVNQPRLCDITYNTFVIVYDLLGGKLFARVHACSPREEIINIKIESMIGLRFDFSLVSVPCVSSVPAPQIEPAPAPCPIPRQRVWLGHYQPL